MSVPINDRYVKATAAAGQTVFNYDWDVPSAYPGQVNVIQYVLATHTKATLTYGVDYTVDVANKRVTLTNAAAAGDTIVLYSGTPEARETDFTGSTVNVTAANEAIDNLTWQTQQLARDVKRCLRVDMVEGIMAGELPSIDARKNKYASWDNDGNLTYDDPVTGILNDYMRKDQNLSDVASVATARTNLGLGDAATRNVGTTAGTVAAGNDSRFLSQVQKDALTGGGNATGMHTHNGYISTAEKGSPNGVATLGSNSKIPTAQIPDSIVKTSTNASSNNEVVLFNGGSGNTIKRSNKIIPGGDIVGTTDAQTLTNKTINADNNTVTELEVDNLKAGVLNTDLTGAVTNTQVPSAQATKDYADTKMGTMHNLGTGVQVGQHFENGCLGLRTLVAKQGISLVQNENDIYIYGMADELFPNFQKQGAGADWLQDVQGQDVLYRSFTGSNGITITENADEIDTSLTNITAQGDMIVGDAGGAASTLAKGADDQVLRMDGDNPHWETLGTMADQNANNVNITGGAMAGVTVTGGTVSGLTAPLALADGGTGQTTKQAAFDGLSPLTTQGDILTHDGTNNVRLARGAAGKYLRVNAGGTDVEWGDGYVTPTTTQGDIIVRGAAADGRLSIGTAGQVLKVNAAGTDPEWGSATSPTLTTQGDLLTRDGTGEVRLPIGTAGQVLQVNAGGTDPEWATLGTMSAQDANAVNITGGTVSGLTTPLAVASGGTGVNAFGTAGQSLAVNKTVDALAWHTFDCLDVADLNDSLANNTDLNTIKTPGTYHIDSTNALVNKPYGATLNSCELIVKKITSDVITQTYNTCWDNQKFIRSWSTAYNSWTDWNFVNHQFFQCARATVGDHSISANTTTILDFNTTNYSSYTLPAGYGWDSTNKHFVVPFNGYFVFRLDANFSGGPLGAEAGLIFYLYKNGSSVSNKGTNFPKYNLCYRASDMFFWYGNKGDIFDIRVLCGAAINLTGNQGGGNNYEDSALYIWSV